MKASGFYVIAGFCLAMVTKTTPGEPWFFFIVPAIMSAVIAEAMS